MTEWYLFGSRFGESVTLVIASFLLGLIPWWLDKRKLQVEDYELWVDTLSESMKNPRATSDLADFGYVVNGAPVQDPHRVELWLWSTGKRDFTKERFNGEPLRIDLGVPVLGELEASVSHELDEADIALEERGVILRPSIVRKQAAVRWTLVTDGKPSLAWNQPFHDTTIASWFNEYAKPEPSRTARKVVGGILVPGVFVLPIALALVGVAFLGIPLGIAALIGGIGGTALTIVGVHMLASADSPGRRLARIRSELRRKIPKALYWERYEHTGNPLGDLRNPHNRRVPAASYPVFDR
ncbi:hypothetical protein DO944_13445 [Microbacterium sp. SMR1]|nr:hypothetical protein DO944_13445 [Microbacterium sp. SMR1]